MDEEDRLMSISETLDAHVEAMSYSRFTFYNNVLNGVGFVLSPTTLSNYFSIRLHLWEFRLSKEIFQ